MHFDTFNTWCDAVYKEGINKMPCRYLIALDSIKMQNRNPRVPPRNRCLFATVGQIDGPSGFSNRNLDIKFNLVNCSNRRNVSAMLPVPAAASKLCSSNSKFLVNINKLSHSMVAELIHLFCLQESHGIDPFSTAMSTSVATLQVNCPCVCIENDPKCYDLAV